jgi:hypothetical protein
MFRYQNAEQQPNKRKVAKLKFLGTTATNENRITIIIMA